MIRLVVYLLRIIKIFHGLMNNPVFVPVFTNRTEFSFVCPQISISASTGDTGGHRTGISASLSVGPV